MSRPPRRTGRPRARSSERSEPEPSERRLDADGVRALDVEEMHSAMQLVGLLREIISDLPTTSDADMYAMATLLGYLREGLLTHVGTCPRCNDTPEGVDRFIARAMKRGAMAFRMERAQEETGGEGSDHVH